MAGQWGCQSHWWGLMRSPSVRQVKQIQTVLVWIKFKQSMNRCIAYKRRYGWIQQMKVHSAACAQHCTTKYIRSCEYVMLSYISWDVAFGTGSVALGSNTPTVYIVRRCVHQRWHKGSLTITARTCTYRIFAFAGLFLCELRNVL